MLRVLLLSPLAFALAACSFEPAPQESADDFASRIGQDENSTGAVSQRDPDAPNTAAAVPPPGADLTRLTKLGDIGGVDLGPREGGCTLMVGKDEMLIAAGPGDSAIPGKAVVRIGDQLVIADAEQGGVEAIRNGTTFVGEGFTIIVRPRADAAERRSATITVRDGADRTQDYSGNWICA